LGEEEILSLVCSNTGLTIQPLRISLRYWAAYRAEVDAEITTADETEQAAERAWRREQELLGR
jgi:hypothetical protein